MLDEIAKTIRAQLYERVYSPLSGIFLLSWCLWNYQFLVVLVSGMSAPEKIAYIHSSLYPHLWPSLANGLLLPLATTAVLIFVYPIPARYVYEYVRKQQRQLKEIRHRIDDETPLTREEAREIRRASLDQSVEYEKEIARQVAEIARLKQELERLHDRAGAQQSSKQPARTLDTKKPPQGSPSFSVKANDRGNSKDLERTRLLLTGSQLMDHLIKDFLQTDKAFDKMKFLVLTDEERLVITLMPEGLSGQGKHYEYAYDSTGSKSIYAEADRVKKLIKTDIANAADPILSS